MAFLCADECLSDKVFMISLAMFDPNIGFPCSRHIKLLSLYKPVLQHTLPESLCFPLHVYATLSFIRSVFAFQLLFYVPNLLLMHKRWLFITYDERGLARAPVPPRSAQRETFCARALRNAHLNRLNSRKNIIKPALTSCGLSPIPKPLA